MKPACVLAAVQRDDTAFAVMRAALGAAESMHLRLQVLTALEPLPLLATDHPASATATGLAREHIADLHAELAAEMARLSPDTEVAFSMVVGPSAPAIRDAATAWHAKLVVMGLGRQTTSDRFFGRETALKVSRGAPAPVLAVSMSAPPRPHRIVAAVDFGEGSRNAVRAACNLAAHSAKLELLHVRPSLNLSGVDQDAWVPVYESGAHRLLAELRDELLQRRPDLRITLLVYGGHAAEVAIELAASSGADLICAGQHSHAMMERLLLGTVASTLLRTSRCAVLVAPPAPAPARITPSPVPTTARSAPPAREVL